MRLLLSISLLLLSIVSNAQDITEISAKEAGLKTFPNPSGFFRGDDGILYKADKKEFPKENRYKLILTRHNEDLSVKFTTTLDFADDREAIEYWFFLENKIYLFTTFYDGANKTLYLKILDKETGKVITDKKPFGSLASDPFGKDARNFPISITPDKSKMLIVSSFQWNKKPQEVKAIIYELPSFKTIQEIKLPDTHRDLLIKTFNYILTPEGNLFYMFRYDVKEKDAPNMQTMVLHNLKDKTTKYKEIDLGNKTLTDSRTITKNNKFYRTGGFQEKLSKKEKKTGVFCFAIDLKDIDKSTLNFDYFPSEIETKLSYKDGAGKRELSEKEISLTGVYETANGFYLVQNLTYKKEISGQSVTVIKFFSRDFIVSKYNAEGKREFVKVLPKYSGKEMINSDIMESNGNLYVFYCEHPKNLEKFTVENYDPTDYDDVGDIRGPVPVGVKIASDGKLSRQTFEKNESWCYYPGYGFKIGDNSLLALRIQKDEFILIVFKIKK
jgi:hypothetical protein